MSLPAFDPEAHLDVMVVSHGHLCVTIRNIGAAVHARYNPARRRFEWCSVAGPLGKIMMYETVAEGDLLAELDGGDYGTARAEVCPYDETPFPEIPAVADHYSGDTYLQPGFQARCECGKSSIGHYSREIIEQWADSHAADCELAEVGANVTVHTVGPHSTAEREAEAMEE